MISFNFILLFYCGCEAKNCQKSKLNHGTSQELHGVATGPWKKRSCSPHLQVTFRPCVSGDFHEQNYKNRIKITCMQLMNWGKNWVENESIVFRCLSISDFMAVASRSVLMSSICEKIPLKRELKRSLAIVASRWKKRKTSEKRKKSIPLFFLTVQLF